MKIITIQIDPKNGKAETFVDNFDFEGMLQVAMDTATGFIEGVELEVNIDIDDQ